MKDQMIRPPSVDAEAAGVSPVKPDIGTNKINKDLIRHERTVDRFSAAFRVVLFAVGIGLFVSGCYDGANANIIAPYGVLKELFGCALVCMSVYPSTRNNYQSSRNKR